MKKKSLMILAAVAALVLASTACNADNAVQSEANSSAAASTEESSVAEDKWAAMTAEEIAEEVGYTIFEEITAEGYYPNWMQPNTVIVYDENGAAEIAEGGELALEELVGRDDIAAVGFSTVGDEEMKIEPNTKVEYDLHGFIQNIYYLWPDGTYNLDYPPEG